jgi:hypothetical protein
MAYAVKFQKKPYVLFGTNCKGLAFIYGYPKNSLLLHRDEVKSLGTYIFLARRNEFVGGVWEIVISKFLRNNKKCFTTKNLLESKLFSEIARFNKIKKNHVKEVI